VIATVITGMTFQIGGDGYIHVLTRSVPETVQCQSQETKHHSIDLMVTQDLPDVVIRCEFLYRPPDRLPWQPWGEIGPRQRDVILSMLDQLGSIAGSQLYQIHTIEAEDSTLEVIDFTDVMVLLIGEGMVKNYNTIYAIEEVGDGDISFYRGVRDFFFERDRCITKIKIVRRGEATIFGEGFEDALPLDRAMPGKIRLQDLLSGEKIHLEVEAELQWMPCQHGVIRIFRIDTGHGEGTVIFDRIGYTEIPEDKG
jgi:hypothetical protein